MPLRPQRGANEHLRREREAPSTAIRGACVARAKAAAPEGRPSAAQTALTSGRLPVCAIDSVAVAWLASSSCTP